MGVNFAVFEVLRVDEDNAVNRVDMTSVVQKVTFAQVSGMQSNKMDRFKRNLVENRTRDFDNEKA